MSKIITKDSKKLATTKSREQSTERNMQKQTRATDPTNSKTKPTTKQKQTTSTVSKIDTNKKAIIKPENKNHLPSTSSRTSLATNKKTPSTSKLSPTNKLISTNPKMKRSTTSTPPSSRVSKTQYFPSKSMYSNVVKEHMQMKSKSAPQEEERPRTATLRQGSIVNSNIVGPDVPQSETSSSVSIETEDNDYEDDFNSYESDFEEYQSSTPTSSINSELLDEDSDSTSESARTSLKQINSAGLEEERMLDSGNYDMPDNKYKLSLTNIKELTEKNTITEGNRSNMASLSDEGFEDGKPLQNSNVPCINFAQAQKRIKQNRHMEKQRKRGEEILNMIKLDNYNFTLFEMAPVSYDAFIKSFGNTNAIQVAIQTGEDNVTEEVQTNNIETTSVWTQFPVAFSKIDCSNPNYLEMYKQEYAGVGCESLKENTSLEERSDKKYAKGLLNASQIILNLLYESHCNFDKKFERNSRDIPFSIGFINFDTQTVSFLKDKPITLVEYYSMNRILTIHGVSTIESNDSYSKSVICVWNVLNTKEPEKVLNAPGLLSCCCCFENNNLIVGGLVEGSLVMWHLGNSNKSFNDKLEEKIMEQPIYISEINTAHLAKVVAVKQLIVKDANALFANNSSNQLCSLDEAGVLIIWVIIHRQPSNSDQNVLYWNQLSLVQNLKMCLTNSYPELSNILCTDMLVNFIDTYHIFISTNYGYILHCLTNACKARPKKYYSSILSQVNCLVACPFSPQHFLAGHNDGSISIYSSVHEKTLIALSNRNDSLHSGVEFIQWSYDKPTSFFVKDYSNTIHVWDLKNSDLYPVYSVPFKQKITAMKLSVPQIKGSDTSYMILATDKGSVHLHILDSQDKQFNLKEYEHDVNNFFNYVNRL